MIVVGRARAAGAATAGNEIELPIGTAQGGLQTEIVSPATGQATMANSLPIAIASDQSALPVTQSGGGAASPWAVRLTDGTSFYISTQQGQLPSALVGGRLDANVGAWLGSTAPTVGQKLAASSIPVVVASDAGIIGTYSDNDGSVTTSTKMGVLPARANTAEPTWTSGNLVPLSVTTTGRQRITVADWLGSTAPTVGQKTGANSLPTVLQSDVGTAGVVGLTDRTNGPATVKAASTAIAATDLPLAVGLHPSSPTPPRATGTQFSISGTSPGTAVTQAVGNPVTGLDQYGSLFVQAVVTGGAGGTVDLYLQVSPDGGTTWVDFYHFTQQAAGVSTTFAVSFSRNEGVVAAAVGTGISPALAANTKVGGDFTDRIRMIVTAGNGTTGGAAQTVRIFAGR